MKLLFIFTGGTIGSTLHGDVISTDGDKSRKIIETYREKFGIGFEYDAVEPYTALSENNTGTDLITDSTQKELLGNGDKVCGGETYIADIEFFGNLLR